MKGFLYKILQAAFTLFGLVTLLFFLFEVLPGDPARMLLDQREDAAGMEAIRHKYGFDRPVGIRYFYYLNDLSPLSLHSLHEGDFTFSGDKYPKITLIRFKEVELVLKMPYLRTSYQKNGEAVTSIIARTLPNTAVLALTAICLAVILGLSGGIFCALYKDSWFDRTMSVVSGLGMSVPSFFAAILFAWIFGFLLHRWTGLPMTGNLYEVDDLGRGEYLSLAALVLPAVTLGIRPLAVITQLTRNSMLDVMRQDYIRTARAKGLSLRRVILSHVLPAAMNPIVTAVSGWFAGMLAGSVFVETIFGWNGLGKTIVDALGALDLPVVMGAIITIAVIFILLNIFTDFIYLWLDPRIRDKS